MGDLELEIQFLLTFDGSLLDFLDCRCTVMWIDNSVADLETHILFKPLSRNPSLLCSSLQKPPGAMNLHARLRPSTRTGHPLRPPRQREHRHRVSCLNVESGGSPHPRTVST